MQVRHLVARDNLSPEGRILDPTAVRHGALRAGRVYALAGPIDAETHLNLDFPDHHLDPCVVVESLTEGAAALATPIPDVDEPASPYLLAATAPTAYDHRGPVDVGARRTAWLAALRERRNAAAPLPHTSVKAPTP
ncbi:MAG: hypothetical protein AVDCRST_MAG77-420 [uncultured Chloroflexi bacterium]|uniref:Uncharacterized protein n=1 Tax=uncultured Chloroflexota bacterium TaxID=166587 RepID=A0A6J4HCI5_9CHLR|nr:MAG: hypothetical protein AVDCRST_MAG77-420 [uncultured Chloroflexota bacterium]